ALAEAYGGDADAGDRVIVYVLITAGLGFFMTIWQSIDQYIQAMMRYEVESKVSDRMYEHFMNLDFWRYDDKNTADLYDRSRNFTQFFAYIFDRLAGMVTTFLTMIGGVAALVVVNWWLALFLLVAIIPGVVIQFKLSKAQIRHWNQNVETRRAKNMIEWNMLEPAKIAELRLYGIVRRLLTMRQELRTKDEK